MLAPPTMSNASMHNFFFKIINQEKIKEEENSYTYTTRLEKNMKQNGTQMTIKNAEFETETSRNQ
jgi:hypothetical protein